MNILWKIAVLGTTLGASFSLQAAPTQVAATIDSTQMYMGSKTLLRVTVVRDKGKAGNLVVPQDTIVKNVEVAGAVSNTVSNLGNNREQASYIIPIQSFDPGTYSLSKLKYVEAGDTIAVPPTALKVIEVDIADLEQTNAGPYDYKPVIDPKMPQPEDEDNDDSAFPWWWIVAGVIVIAAASWFIINRLKKGDGGKIAIPLFRRKPLLPPYEEAVKSFLILNKQELLKKGETKLYYIRLTNIVRRYISRLYGINAMEMTSVQIMDAVRRNEAVKGCDNLSFLLETADFVKFAKMQPSDDENVRSLSEAKTFVEVNKPIEQPDDEKSSAKEKKKEK